ncbi:porin family protein [Flavobacterium wongokense]|uniref:porin family protein n=1 Tax=Flavobacterium wongokense TaxID=2910674 RepID=UPI001F392FDC|nr:porin family protein [Flavobacterium sp. WG47]MCF6133523.1 PorT family protein [Flavobacterium sp. WG47]
MRKNIITLVAVLGLSATLFAQQKKGDVEFGFNIGYNSSSASDEYDSTDTGSGLNVGGQIDYYFSPSWSIKGKLIYDQKGWDNDYIEDIGGNVYPTDINLNYLTIPVMANWHFGNKKNWYLNFGPYLGFLLDAKDTRFDSDISDAFNSNDFGLAVGIGVKIPVSNKLKIFLEYDGQGGFTDIFKDNQYSAVTNTRSSFNVGLNFLMK